MLRKQSVGGSDLIRRALMIETERGVVIWFSELQQAENNQRCPALPIIESRTTFTGCELRRSEVGSAMRLRIGTSGFQYPEWKGTFYPEKMPVNKMLPFYAERFSSTEINYSFRRIQSEKTISNWAEATPAEFKFTFKAPQKVTHFARLRDCEDTVLYFNRVISRLEEKLGTVLFQLPPDFKRDVERLQRFLESLPSSMRAAFEFRNESWFAEEVFSVLRDHNAALCIAQSEKVNTPRVSTADFGYLRLRREDYTEEDIADWAEHVQSESEKWSDAYVYFKHEESGVGPKFAKQMQGLLKEMPVEISG